MSPKTPPKGHAVKMTDVKVFGKKSKTRRARFDEVLKEMGRNWKRPNCTKGGFGVVPPPCEGHTKEECIGDFGEFAKRQGIFAGVEKLGSLNSTFEIFRVTRHNINLRGTLARSTNVNALFQNDNNPGVVIHSGSGYVVAGSEDLNWHLIHQLEIGAARIERKEMKAHVSYSAVLDEKLLEETFGVKHTEEEVVEAIWKLGTTGNLDRYWGQFCHMTEAHARLVAHRILDSVELEHEVLTELRALLAEPEWKKIKSVLGSWKYKNRWMLQDEEANNTPLHQALSPLWVALKECPESEVSTSEVFRHTQELMERESGHIDELQGFKNIQSFGYAIVFYGR